MQLTSAGPLPFDKREAEPDLRPTGLMGYLFAHIVGAGPSAAPSTTRRMPMRSLLAALALSILSASAQAQTPRKFPPDSLVNTKVIPHSTPVPQVLGLMRNFAGDLGVRCQFCHVGEEGQPLDRFDFASDDKRTKLVARQMMLMLQEINRRLDTIPRASTAAVPATCGTC
ncbi:MAG: c-type cytochrome, partial [Gemmatimonadaceae bacterium]